MCFHEKRSLFEPRLNVPRGLAPVDLERLSSAGRLEAVPRRRSVPLDGPALVVVMGGFFRIYRHAAFVRDVTLGLAVRGDVLAAGAAFGDRVAETGAEALSAGQVLLLSPEVWRACAEDQPELNIKMAASIGKRVTRLQQRLEEISRAGVEGRVAASLLDLAEDFGSPCFEGVRLDVPLSQEDLARLAGTTRETCSSVVAGFGRRGLVRGGRLRGLVLIDRPALARLAQRLAFD